MKTLGLRIPPEILKRALENLHGSETSATEINQQIQDQWLGSEARAAEALYLLDQKKFKERHHDASNQH